MPSATEFSGLLGSHAAALDRVVAAYAWNRADRADLAQEIAVQLWRAFPHYDATRPFSTWMYRIALNVAITHVRQETRRLRHHVGWEEEAASVAAPDNPEAAWTSQQLAYALAQCNPLDRSLLLLHAEGHPHAAVAEILGLSASNVGTKIHRLLQRLRTQFFAS